MPKTLLSCLVSAALAVGPSAAVHAEAPSALAQLGAMAQTDVSGLAQSAARLDQKLFELTAPEKEGGKTRLTIRDEQLGQLFRVSATLIQADGDRTEAAEYLIDWMRGDWHVYFEKEGEGDERKVKIVRKNLVVHAEPGTPEARMLERSYSDSPLGELDVQKPGKEDDKAPGSGGEVPKPPLEVKEARGARAAGPEGAAAAAPEGEDGGEKTLEELRAEAAAANKALAEAEREARDNRSIVNVEDLFTKDVFGVAKELGKAVGGRAQADKVENLRAFSSNMEIDVRYAVTATAGTAGSRRASSPDKFYVTVHYSVVRLPDREGFEAREADQRVGYFTAKHLDYSRPGLKDALEPNVRNIYRWRLEKLHPEQAVSDVKDPVTYWIDETVPEELSPLIERGITAWNQAFEEIGLRGALEVRRVADLSEEQRKDWSLYDAGNDVVVTMFASPRAYAQGPMRADPLTGEIYSAAIRLSDKMVRYFRADSGDEMTRQLKAQLTAAADWSDREIGRVHDPRSCTDPAHNHPGEHARQLETWAARQAAASRVMKGLGLFTKKDEQRFFEEAIVEVIAHEAGHTLGLRHNFKGSAQAGPGGELTSSVMDYNSVNLPRETPRGLEHKGSFYQTVLGAYDRWAIKYGYKPLEGKTADARAGELAAIADESRRRPELAYGTDEDAHIDDPDTRLFDGPGDPIAYARVRNRMAGDLFERMAERAKDTKDPMAYAELKDAVGAGLQAKISGLFDAADLIGGLHQSRQTAASDGAGHEDGFKPVDVRRQRQAVRFLVDEYLDESKVSIDPVLLRRMVRDRRGTVDAFGNMSFEEDVEGLAGAMQRAAVGRLLSPYSHWMLNNSRQLADNPDAEVLATSELFEAAREGVWSEVAGAKGPLRLSRNRQDLQVYHVERLRLLHKKGIDREDTLLAARSLKRVKEDLDRALDPASGVQLDPVTKLHLEELQEKIEVHFSKPVPTTDSLSVLERIGFAVQSAFT